MNQVPEAVERRRVRDCSRVVATIAPMELVEKLNILPVDHVTEKKGRIEIVYLYTPDEFTKKRLKVRIEASREEGRLALRGRGALNMDLLLECRDDELIATIAVVGKGERYVTAEKLREAITSIVELIEERAPRPVAPLAPPARVEEARPAEARPTPVAVEARPVEAEASRAEAEAKPLTCVDRLATAGLDVDEELSRMVRSYHLQASLRGSLVEDGRSSSLRLDLSKYREGFNVRVVAPGFYLETVRVNGRVGVYVRDEEAGVEAYGSKALELVEDRLCSEDKTVTYMVIRLPRE